MTLSDHQARQAELYAALCPEQLEYKELLVTGDHATGLLDSLYGDVTYKGVRDKLIDAIKAQPDKSELVKNFSLATYRLPRDDWPRVFFYAPTKGMTAAANQKIIEHMGQMASLAYAIDLNRGPGNYGQNCNIFGEYVRLTLESETDPYPDGFTLAQQKRIRAVLKAGKALLSA